MSAEIVPQQTATAAAIASLAEEPARINPDALLHLHRTAMHEGDAFALNIDRFNLAVDNIDDDRATAIVLELLQRREEIIANRIDPIDWAISGIKASIQRRLRARREASQKSSAEIPHKHLKIAFEVKYGYSKDELALQKIAADLSEEDAAAVVKVVPEREVSERTVTGQACDVIAALAAYKGTEQITVTIPAYTVPESVTAGNTGSIKAIIDRFPDSPIATALQAALGRKVVDEKFVFEPIAPAMKTVKPR